MFVPGIILEFDTVPDFLKELSKSETLKNEINKTRKNGTHQITRR